MEKRITPAQALEELDNVVQQVNLPRNAHAHMINCKEIIFGAFTELARVSGELALAQKEIETLKSPSQ